GVPERRSVTEGVPGGLADRETLGLQLLADLAVALPGLGELLRANLVEQGLPVGDQPADDDVRGGAPDAVHLGQALGGRVVAALLLADRIDHAADIHQALRVEMREVVLEQEDVRAAAGGYGGGDARLDVVGIDGLARDLCADALAGGDPLRLEPLSPR